MIRSALNSYWDNEANIEALTQRSGCTIEQIVENPNSYPSEIVARLRQLLLRKKQHNAFDLDNAYESVEHSREWEDA